MKLFFEITSGDREGSRFEIRDGLSVGRKGTDVVLRDPKVSTRHAVVEERDHGFFLTDLGSSNGLKIEGNRVSEAQLLPGVSIQIGRTHLLVIDIDEVGATPDKPIVKTWQESVLSILERVEKTAELKTSRTAAQKVRMFTQPIELKAVAGPQVGESWTLVYGPRDIGAGTLDVRLIEEGIPKVAFQISQTSDGIMIKTEHADVVSLNGAQVVKSQTVNDGDEITVHNTRLQVKLRDV